MREQAEPDVIVQAVAPTIAELRVGTLLRETCCAEWTVSTAERSPLGPRALRISVSGARSGTRPPDVGRILGTFDWVDAAVTRAANTYVRVATDALCLWVSDAYAASHPAEGREGIGREVSVTWSQSSADRRSLDDYRRAVTARAAAVLLRSRGFNAELGDDADGSSNTVTVSSGSPPGGSHVPLVIGEVDIPHGALRARYGGTVDADDVLGELATSLQRILPDVVEDMADGCLSVALLRIERSRRVLLADGKLHTDLATFVNALEAKAIAASRALAAAPRKAVGDERAERMRRVLALELDALPAISARAASRLDAAPLVRHGAAIAGAVRAAAEVDVERPLWSAADDGLTAAFLVSGVRLGVRCSANSSFQQNRVVRR